MKTIFSDIYNKIMDWFQIERSGNTSECAANRLQVILMHDRTKLDPLIMNKMREELIDVFSKYVVIDKEELEIGLKNEGDAVALMLNIPIVRAKTEEELEELRKKLQDEEEKIIEEPEDVNSAVEVSNESSEQESDDEIVEETVNQETDVDIVEDSDTSENITESESKE
ncbi:MAG: cell division topological specificity factor MinE [Candidatus Gastranaerophilales bacterium]|nr:cell division topological specificity factor MinE [Candidatus Gastranaerophilales bacterium]